LGATNTAFRWNIERRLKFIEFKLFSESHVNRGDLMDVFGISVNQASADLNRYVGTTPDNMVYEKSARAYVRGDRFDPWFFKLDAARYLSQLRSIAAGILAQENTWIGQVPAFDSVPSPVRNIDARQDTDWHTQVTLEIRPHPGLSDEQKKVIALDYGMQDRKASISVRNALLYYTLKRLGLDTAPAAKKRTDRIHTPERTLHARFFVRRLPAEMHASRRDG